MDIYRENNAILLELDEAKVPYLFTSENLLRLTEVTTSLRTQLTIIAMIGPRLIDPRGKTTELLDLFRFADQRAKVEEILKARATALAVTIYKNSPTSTTPGGGRGAGRGGRGAGGLALPGRRKSGTPAKADTPGSEVDSSDRPPRPPPSEVTSPYTPHTPGPTTSSPATNSDNSPGQSTDDNGALSVLQRPSRGITFVDNRKSSFALKKPAAEPTSVSSIRKSSDSKASNNNSGTPLMRSATNSRRPSNTGDSLESVTKGITSLLGEEAKSYSSLDGYATPPRSTAARSGSQTPVTGGEDSAPRSRYAKEESGTTHTVEIIPSSLGVENLRKAFLSKAIDKDRDAIQSLVSTPRSARTFKAPSPISVPAQKVSESTIVDAVSKIAKSVGLETKEFLSLEPEDPLEVTASGFPYYSYRELVRQNYRKSFMSGVNSGELENHMVDEEFEKVFGMKKVCNNVFIN